MTPNPNLDSQLIDVEDAVDVPDVPEIPEIPSVGFVINDIISSLPLLNEYAAKYFFKNSGAKKIKTEKMLGEALDAMFYFRASLGLEEQRVYDDISYAFGDLSTCTKKTRE